jgi:Peptidase propeptide and YPEB domain
MRLLIAAAVAAAITGPAFAQTQATSPSSYATTATLPSAFATSALSPCYSSFNPTSPCYSGNIYLSYSAIAPIEFSDTASRKVASLGADSLNQQEATSRIEAKGYSDVAGLKKDDHGIWRGKATMKDGRSVAVILDLQGNIYSELRP